MCRSVQALENQSAHAGYNIDEKILSPEVNLTFALQCTMIQKLRESACERTWCHLYLDCNSTGQYQVSLTSSCACSTLLILASAVLLPAATSPVLQMSLSMAVCDNLLLFWPSCQPWLLPSSFLFSSFRVFSRCTR